MTATAHHPQTISSSTREGVTMSVSAIVMMLIAMLTVWGGLAAAIVNLIRHPDPAE